MCVGRDVFNEKPSKDDLALAQREERGQLSRMATLNTSYGEHGRDVAPRRKEYSGSRCIYCLALLTLRRRGPHQTLPRRMPAYRREFRHARPQW